MRTGLLASSVGLVALAATIAACSAEGGGSAVAGNGASANGGSSSGGTGASSSGGTGASSSGGSGATISTDSGTDGSSSNGCTKTDFLFVVDSSVSMRPEQVALTAAFPQFIGSILNATTISDFHVMVVDTDAFTRCTASACAGTPHSTCNQYACDNVYTGCDETMGAGVVQPTGQDSSNQICPIDGGKRYMDSQQTNLSDTFSCVATVGLAGHPSERPMEAMVAALSPELNGPGGCNEGFLRDDAILVVTFISDDPNKEDAGTAQDWYDAVVASKNGKPESVVMLGLIPDGASATPTRQLHWHDFVALWGTRGIKGDVAAVDYAPFFDSAIAVISDTCDDFVPPR